MLLYRGKDSKIVYPRGSLYKAIPTSRSSRCSGDIKRRQVQQNSFKELVCFERSIRGSHEMVSVQVSMIGIRSHKLSKAYPYIKHAYGADETRVYP